MLLPYLNADKIEAGCDSTDLLAKVYWTILRYLSGSARLEIPENDEGGLSPEAWLEGAEDAVRVIIPDQKDTESELYLRLRGINGIRSFATCPLSPSEQSIIIRAYPAGTLYKSACTVFSVPIARVI